MRIATTLFSTLALGALLSAPVAADAFRPAQGKYSEQPVGHWDDRRPHPHHWGPPRGYYPPPPVYYAPPPRYHYSPPPVYYAPPPRHYYSPPPVYYAPPPRYYYPPPPPHYYRAGPPGIGLQFRF